MMKKKMDEIDWNLYFSKARIEVIVDLKSREKVDVLREMLVALTDTEVLGDTDVPFALQSLLEREEMCSTSYSGVALPHARYISVNKLGGAIGLSHEGINWDSLDEEPVHIVLLLISPLLDEGSFLIAEVNMSRLGVQLRKKLKSFNKKAFLKLINKKNS